MTITGVDNGDQTDDVSVTVSATAANTSSLGVVDPEPVALVIADDETTPVVTLSLSPSEIAEHQGWTFVTAMLDSRSSADTTVTVSAEPAELIEQREENTLTIPAGQTESIGSVWIQAVDNDELAEATQTVTVSGTSENAQGVAGPENVTLTIIDDEAPFFADDSIAYTFTTGIAGSRFLPEAEFGNGKLTYSLSPAPSNDVIFTPGPPARIGVSATSVAAGETSYTLTATDADGDTDTMTISITVRKGVCPNSAAVSGYSDPGIVHDCEALLASRDTLSVDQSLNWDEDLPIDEWKGVELADGRVVGLLMSSEGIVGTIPSELGNLSNLRWLDLSGNRLTGGIPKELGSLANLLSLSLSGNRLTGGIPEELGSLANLQGLDLWGNQLTGEIPKELGNLSNLTRLVLAGNQLTGEIPPELGRLSNLTELYLHGNQLTGEIPPELGGLSNLTGLYLSDNRLTGCVPPRLRDVPDNDLDQLGLPFCPLSPPEASTISSVTSEMDSLTISWATPLSDGGSDITAYDLRHIETDDDEAVGSNWTVAEDVWTSGGDALEYTLTGLTVGTEYDIQVRAVNAVGDGPWSATVTATLTTVSTCAAGVAVPDPTSNPGLLAVCESLLTLLDTLVEGTVLNWSADIPISEWDGIEEDSLEGTPPQVVRLYLGGLGLDGAVPSELSGLTELKELYLQDNDLSGPVPVELGDLSSLTHLHLQNNDLTGGIPAELGDLAVLRELRLDNNDLTGQLPPELGSLIRVTRLWVADNDLSGSIPAELGDMANLDWLNLGRNNFNGQIPAELGNLSRMRRLYIYENDLSGPIPGALGSLSRLTHIVAQANDLSGEIPEELGSLANLVWMGLHDNDLTGEIPAELGGLAKLQRLYLTNNELYGEVPEELGDLSALTNLWLNHNYLSGQIPHSLDNLDKLSRLRLAGNRLTGCLPAGLAAVRNSDADQLGLETCADPAVGTEYGVQEKTASGAVAPKQAATGDCATGGAVPDAANNPGLVSDCEALLAAREALVGNTGNAELNWSADIPISEWDGIEEDSLEGSPLQVVRLYLGGLGLEGAVPSELSGLTELKEL